MARGRADWRLTEGTFGQSGAGVRRYEEAPSRRSTVASSMPVRPSTRKDGKIYLGLRSRTRYGCFSCRRTVTDPLDSISISRICYDDIG